MSTDNKKDEICWNEDMSRQEVLYRYIEGEEPQCCCDECARELMEFLKGSTRSTSKSLLDMIPKHARKWFT